MKKALTILLAILLSFAVGCTAQEGVIEAPAQVTRTDQIVADTKADEDPTISLGDAEIAWPLYTSVEEMIRAIQAEYKDDMERMGKVGELSTLYVPPQTLQGFRLYLIEVNPYYVFYYYVQEGEAVDYFDWSSGIIVTVSRKSEMTMDSICDQLELVTDEDGFAYDAEMREMHFAQDGTVISFRVPEHINDYDTLRKLCKVKRIEITEDALAEASWEIDEVEETDTEITEDAPAIATWEMEPSERSLWYPSVEELIQSGHFESLTTVYTPPEEIEGFTLLNIELFPFGMTYYYNPGEVLLDQFDWNRGITYTIFQNGVITFKSVCETSEVLPDEDGFAYDAKRNNMHFEEAGIAVSIHVPEEPNDYDTLRSLCELEKVTVP